VDHRVSTGLGEAGLGCEVESVAGFVGETRMKSVAADFEEEDARSEEALGLSVGDEAPESKGERTGDDRSEMGDSKGGLERTASWRRRSSGESQNSSNIGTTFTRANSFKGLDEGWGLGSRGSSYDGLQSNLSALSISPPVNRRNSEEDDDFIGFVRTMQRSESTPVESAHREPMTPLVIPHIISSSTDASSPVLTTSQGRMFPSPPQNRQPLHKRARSERIHSNLLRRPAFSNPQHSQQMQPHPPLVSSPRTGLDMPNWPRRHNTDSLLPVTKHDGRASPVSRFGPSLGIANHPGRRRNTLWSPRERAQPKATRTRQMPSFSVDSVQLGARIGGGAFASVHKAFDQRTGIQLAVKRIKFQNNDFEQKRAIEEELKIMRCVEHKHVVQFLADAREEENQLVEIYLEFVAGGSLNKIWKTYGALNEALIRKFAKQILCGLEHIHNASIIHRDIKGANILVTQEGICKIADFGCSKFLGDMKKEDIEKTLKTMRGSVPWMAPEVVREQPYGLAADIWSFGATMLEIGSAMRPWHTKRSQLDLLIAISQTKSGPPIPTSFTFDFRQFLSACFQAIGANRPTCFRLHNYPFLRNHLPVFTGDFSTSSP